MEKELKKLSRRELVDVIYQMKKNEQQLQDEIASLKEELNDKRIRISYAGSVADAAADVTQLFSTAQKTADLYLQEIAYRKEETKTECEKMIADAKHRVEQIISEGDMQIDSIKKRYQIEYEQLEQLQKEIHTLEQTKNQIACEGTKNVEQT